MALRFASTKRPRKMMKALKGLSAGSCILGLRRASECPHARELFPSGQRVQADPGANPTVHHTRRIRSVVYMRLRLSLSFFLVDTSLLCFGICKCPMDLQSDSNVKFGD